MCDEIRDFPITFGNGKLTLGDLYDKTPKDKISKVMLEKKIFKTWHHGRTVLFGDACHKLNPSAGQEYQDERLPAAIDAYKSSQMLSMILNKGFAGVVALFISQNALEYLWNKFVRDLVRNRPYVGFLHRMENKGALASNVSPSSEKVRALFEKRMGATAL
ncbi:hypothetical protein BGW39_009851 [Mortierella sp. 14UC]|nr:hypothetical protein BGW39_009851 [Mortierella sp. 14UC]